MTRRDILKSFVLGAGGLLLPTGPKIKVFDMNRSGLLRDPLDELYTIFGHPVAIMADDLLSAYGPVTKRQWNQVWNDKYSKDELISLLLKDSKGMTINSKININARTLNEKFVRPDRIKLH